MLERLTPYLGAARRHAAIGVVALLLAAGAELLTPWPIKALVDYVFGSIEPPAWLGGVWPAFADGSVNGMIVGICIAVLAIGVIHRGLSLIGNYVLIKAGADITARLRCAVCEHLHRLSLTWHDKSRVGDSIYRAAYDTTAALSLISQAFAPAIVGLVMVVGIIAMMAQLDLLLTGITALIVPAFALLIQWFGKRIERRTKQYHEAESSLVAMLQESLSSIRAVQAFTREPHIARQVDERANDSLRALCKQVVVQLGFQVAIGGLMAIGTAAIVGFGAYRVSTGALSIGDVLVFLAYLGMLYQPINSLSQSVNVIHTARTQIKRVFEVLDTPAAIIDKPDAVAPESVVGAIEFNGVGFEYEPGRPALEGVSFAAEPGSVTAIVGRSGAGKTTMVSLLLRFYDPTVGSVRLDGRDLRDLPLQWLREQVSVVLQDTLLFSATVADNIAYARPGATREQVIAAAERAQADDFIRALPDGYDTELGERGVALSGGQRQRIAIARAFLKDAKVLIFDEPTSALDEQTEHDLMDAMSELIVGRTTFVIAHRPRTIQMADTVLTLDAGRLTESDPESHPVTNDMTPPTEALR